MAIDDGPKDYYSSLGLYARDVKQNGDAPSAEDVAWADSCLTIDSLSQSGWESFRDALLDARDPHSDSHKQEHDFRRGTDTERIKSSKTTENAVNFSNGADTEMTCSSQETETSVNLDKAPDYGASFINDSNVGIENGDTFVPGFNLENVFLPTYNERHSIVFSDPEYESSFPAFLIDDPSPKDIFKVWELGSSVEDEKLINELNKPLSEKPSEPLPAASDVSGASDGMQELEDMISGVEDLSLIEDDV